MITLPGLDAFSSAAISPDGLYRYRLDRAVSPGRSILNFIMVNPSTADGDQDDPTIRKCIGFTRSLGFDRLVVTNLFGLRSTDPKGLARVADPIGRDNDRHIIEAAHAAGLVICGWGALKTKVPKRWQFRAPFLLRLLSNSGITPHALKLTGRGDPTHPLFLKADLKPFPMKA